MNCGYRPLDTEYRVAELIPETEAADLLGGFEKHPAAVAVDNNPPTMQQLSPILDLHRHSDGYVAFAVADDGRFAIRFAIRRDALQQYFPEYVSELAKDSFVSINAAYRAGTYRSSSDRSRLRPEHRCDTMRYLCACYVDIDFYKVGIKDFGEANARLFQLKDAGIVPPWSVLIRSGRGMWLLWFLKDCKEDNIAQQAFPEKIELYHRIQAAIVERLSDLGADPCAKDAARYVRVPESLHTTSENVVTWLRQDRPGSLTYTLQQLADVLNIAPRHLHPIARAAFEIPKKKYSNRAKGWKALHARRLRDFETLRALRGGRFSQGCRHYGALVYTLVLRNNGVSRDEIRKLVAQFANSCSPRLPHSEVESAMQTVFGRGDRKPTITRLTEQTIGKWLRITQGEAEDLEGFPAAIDLSRTGFSELRTKEGQHRRRSADERRRHIAQIVERNGGMVPSGRKMAAALKGDGFDIGHAQVAADYKALGLVSTAAARRCRNQQSAELLFEIDAASTEPN